MNNISTNLVGSRYPAFMSKNLNGKESPQAKLDDIKSDNSQVRDNYGRYIAFKANLKPIQNNNSDSTPVKLNKLRDEMKKENIDVLLEMSTDKYLNENVDKNQSQRVYISDFTGSAGDVIITPDKARLVVDGRYHIQADQQVDHECYEVEKAGIDKEGKPVPGESYSDRFIKVLSQLSQESSPKTLRVGYDPNKISVSRIRSLDEKFKNNGSKIVLVPTTDNLVDRIRNDKPVEKTIPAREVPLEFVGESSKNKLEKLRDQLSKAGANATIVTDLNDVAYLTNLRGKDIDYSVVFKSKAFITKDKAFVFCNPEVISPEIKEKFKGVIEFKPEDMFEDTIKEAVASSEDPVNIAIPLSTTNCDTYNKLQEVVKDKGSLIEINESPVSEMRAIKNEKELATMQDGITRTDKAVNEVINWINKKVQDNEIITEKDLEDKTRESHFKYGANDLSFEIIPATGANGAIIHYSSADPNKVIQKGEYVLLDTGAYYEPGYATDLTRTWIAGGEKAEPTDEQKKIYTLVLKGSLRGLNAELPPGTKGTDIDKTVRKPINDEGYNYLHGTGHGIGIQCHESPSTSSEIESKEGMVFSIEPGIYIKDWGGVRFENLVTVIKHPDPEKAKEGWHKIKSLSYAPIDHNLIDKKLLNEQELQWVKEFDKKSEEITG